jgi:DNA ligase (NAD+)
MGGVALDQRKPGAKPIAYTQVCPVCGTPLVRADGEAGFYCPNQDGCLPQLLGHLEHFVSRKAMDIDSLGSERLKMLYDAGLVRNVADLYDLRRQQLVGLDSSKFANAATAQLQEFSLDAEGQEGGSFATAPRASTIQEKGADNILKALEESKQVPFERVLYALGIRYVGEVGAKKLARYFGNMEALMAASVMELAMVEDVGEVTAVAVFDYFNNPHHRQMVERLKQAGLQMQVIDNRISNVLEGMTIVVSGTFDHFSRDEIKASIEQHGGKASGSISSKTTYLLAGAKVGPEKLKKAEKLGVPLLTEEEYLAMINQK